MQSQKSGAPIGISVRPSVLRAKAPAKINIALDVVSRRADGYHDLDMLMSSVNIYDDIHVSLTGSSDEIKVICDREDIPQGEGNIVYKAVSKFFAGAEVDPVGVKVRIRKRIPQKAGLGGASADAAAVLLCLDRLLGTGLTQKQLIAIAATIGADVPFCLVGGMARVAGIGEKITPLAGKCEMYLVVVKPDVDVSTPWAFEVIDQRERVARPDIARVKKALDERNVSLMCRHMANSFEEVIAGMFGIIDDIRRDLHVHGALGASMSGSGPSMFGVFQTAAQARTAARALREKYRQRPEMRIFPAKTCAGIELEW